MVSKQKSLAGILVREKPLAIFLAVSDENSDNYCSKLVTKAHCTYSHGLSLLGKMGKAGLLTFEKRGRRQQVKLTNKGIEVGKNFKVLMKRLD